MTGKVVIHIYKFVPKNKFGSLNFLDGISNFNLVLFLLMIGISSFKAYFYLLFADDLFPGNQGRPEGFQTSVLLFQWNACLWRLFLASHYRPTSIEWSQEFRASKRKNRWLPVKLLIGLNFLAICKIMLFKIPFKNVVWIMTNLCSWSGIWLTS